MFRCQFCNKVSSPKEKRTLIVTETKTVRDPKTREDTTQIAKEKAACAKCAAAKLTST